MENITKRELVVKISNETGIVQHQVSEIVQKMLDEIIKSLSNGRDVEMRNFGIFEVRLTKPRVGRNPGKPDSNFNIPPKAVVKFKPGKIMRQKVSPLAGSLKRAEMDAED